MTRNSKAKGRLGQQEIRDKILDTFPKLHPDDVKSTVMGDTGEDIQLSPAARKMIPLSIEVKRRKGGLKTVYATWNRHLNMVKENLLCSLGQTDSLGL